MTRKIYKSAMGKEVDLGSLLLQNEHVRAVGNMNVNARGDLLDGTNKVIDQKNRQVQRQYKRTTNVSGARPVRTSDRKKETVEEPVEIESFEDLSVLDTSAEPMVAPTPVETTEQVFPPTGEGGLASAIARSRLIKQEKEKTLKEKQQAQGIRKI